MTYLWLDEGFGDHSKVENLSHIAFRAHVLALLHCARNLTDGHVSDRALKVIAVRLAARPKKLTDELVDAGLWVRIPDGICIHDYLEHNPSAEQVKAKKDAARKAALARWGAKGSANGNAERIAIGNALSHPSLSHPESEALLQGLTSYEGGDDSSNQENYNHALETLITDCGGTDEAREKLAQVLMKHPAPEARLVAVHWAVTQPGTRDRLGKALSMIRKEAA